MRRALAVLLAPFVGLALLVSLPGAASAVARAADPHDAPLAYDMRLVRLYPDLGGAVTVQLLIPFVHVGPHFNGIDVYLDTRGTGAADYRVGWQLGHDGDGLTRFELFRVNGHDVVGDVPCPGLDAHSRKRDHTTAIYVPRSCLSITKSVRAQVYTWDYTRYRNGEPVRGRADRAPNHGWLR